ncbi:MAG: SDR family oxidoreductase [Solirubrobacterales bacterium]
MGYEVEYRHLDVTSEREWAETVEYCRAKLGGPSILVNNAGMYTGRRVHDETPEGWQRTIDVNLTSVFLGMRAVIPYMLEDGGGAIVNTSSMWGLIASELNAAYHASKGGVTLLSKHAGAAYAQEGIRVNSVHPGGVQTTMIEETGQANQDATASRAPMRRLGDPQEIAAAIAFLASDDASYMTGATLVVDGGFTAI